ncbi:MAG: pyridoxal phosphate-dependent aminotransferase [Terriglobales bacterium]
MPATEPATAPTAPFSPPLVAAISRLGGEGAYEVLARARALEAEGRSVIHLEIGEPDFPTPAHILEAGAQALRDGYTHYATTPGLPVLREAIAASVQQSHGVSVSPDEVVVTPGAKPVVFYALTALAGAGDEVIYSDPAYPIYGSLVRYLGATPRPIRLREADGFRMDIGELEAAINPRTRLVILNSPQNPTGGMLTGEDVSRLARAIARSNAMVLSDEIYRRITFGATHHSIFSAPGMRERAILMDGFSKCFAMTGWRLGYGVMPRALAETMGALLTNTVSCTATFTQLAGVAALTGDQQPVADMVAEFHRRRDLCVARLNQVPGIRCLTPPGAFYLFPNIQGTGLSSRQFADGLLQQAGVAVLSGAAFGPGGEGYIRISYANSIENLTLALDRIASFVTTPPGR